MPPPDAHTTLPTADTVGIESPFSRGTFHATPESAFGIDTEDPSLEALLEEWTSTQLIPEPLPGDPTPEEQLAMIQRMDSAVRMWFRAWLIDVKRRRPLGIMDLPLRDFMSFRTETRGDDAGKTAERITEIERLLFFQTVSDHWKYSTPADLTPRVLMNELGFHCSEAFDILSVYITEPIINILTFRNSAQKKLQRRITQWLLGKLTQHEEPDDPYEGDPYLGLDDEW